MDIKKLLKRWGYWATPRLGTEYPCMAVGITGAIQKYFVLPLSDEEGMAIERCMLLIRKVEPVLYDVLMMRYVYRISDKEVTRQYNISRRDYYSKLVIAETSIKLMLTQNKCIFLA